ncbi:MAG: hypothetical protein A2W31_13410 [Planctomycetes bacterium RBG_16_64_10]|nr:MAG: hypothetical protein A2W31_13410 [Planctomycetes bacterium RBG_16_64_10]
MMNQASRETLAGTAGRCSAAPWLAVTLLTTCQPLVSLLSAAEGFTEPYRTIQVAAAESGVVSEIAVQEGATVKKGDVLATLDREVFQVLLAIADQAMRSTGALDSALAELHLREERLVKLTTLREQGHARQEELDRAEADRAIAEAHVRSAREELAVRKLEYEKTQAQVERRTVRAPQDGVVTDIHKDAGEYLAPNDPYLLTLVQLDPLLATFSLTRRHASQLQIGQQVTVRCADAASAGEELTVPVKGTVEFIAPVINAESGTVRVKVRIENPNGQYRSGERCALEAPKGGAAAKER